MSLTNNHIIAGLPAWADDDTADAAAAAVTGQTDQPAHTADSDQSGNYVAAWKAVAALAWAKAYLALDSGDQRQMRAHAAQAADADDRASAHGQLVGAIFGVAQMPDQALVAQGNKLPADQVAAARAAVKAAMPKPAPRKQKPRGRKPSLVAPVTDAHRAVVAHLQSVGAVSDATGLTQQQILNANLPGVCDRIIGMMKTKGMIRLGRKGKYFI